MLGWGLNTDAVNCRSVKPETPEYWVVDFNGVTPVSHFKLETALATAAGRAGAVAGRSGVAADRAAQGIDQLVDLTTLDD